MSIVRQPTESASTWSVNPRVVMYSRPHLRLAGHRIEQHHPTIFVISRARHEHRVLAVLRPLQLRELHVAIPGLRGGCLLLRRNPVATAPGTDFACLARVHLSALRWSGGHPLTMIDILCLAGLGVDDYE